ncbi:hypothetical protein MESS4_380014 [Mesorhizobium sp. STM 4661]|nr:hypothetical protein MESS4_380014 [Mesorhizobium sp. STM 4661]
MRMQPRACSTARYRGAEDLKEIKAVAADLKYSGAEFRSVAILPTPLCPAGHLPRKGGDRQLRCRRSSCNACGWRKR